MHAVRCTCDATISDTLSEHQRVEPTCLCCVAGCSDGKYNTFEAQSSQNIDSGRPSSGAPDEDEDESSAHELPHLSAAEANEDSSHLLYDDTGHLSNEEAAAAGEAAAAEEAAADEESVEEVEEDDDSKDDDDG